jgi:hypothetical protein
MLKVVLAPDEVPEGFVQNYCLLIGDRSFTNFQKILDLKGTPRGDQQKLVDIFLSVTSTKDDLADTSFLTGLDMDPGSDKSAAAAAHAFPAANNNVIPVAALFSPTLPSGSGGVLPSLLNRSSTDNHSPDPNRTETPRTFGEFRRLVQFATRRDTYT